MKSGLAFHCHHDVLIEYVYDYDERSAYIKAYKPKNEQKLRLRLFKMIPAPSLPKTKAWPAYDKARAAYDKARAAYENSFDVDALHRRLCKNCPWDGKTIFPVKSGAA